MSQIHLALCLCSCLNCYCEPEALPQAAPYRFRRLWHGKQKGGGQWTEPKEILFLAQQLFAFMPPIWTIQCSHMEMARKLSKLKGLKTSSHWNKLASKFLRCMSMLSLAHRPHAKRGSQVECSKAQSMSKTRQLALHEVTG